MSEVIAEPSDRQADLRASTDILTKKAGGVKDQDTEGAIRRMESQAVQVKTSKGLDEMMTLKIELDEED